MSKKLKEILGIIKAKTGAAVGEVAAGINYSRGHLSRLANDESGEQDDSEVIDLITKKYAKVLQGVTLEPVPKSFTPDQLFAMFLEVTKAQTVILNNIENKMARESTQGQMKISLDRVDKVVQMMSERQEDGIIEFRRRFSKLGAGEEGPLRSTRKKADHSGRGV